MVREDARDPIYTLGRSEAEARRRRHQLPELQPIEWAHQVGIDAAIHALTSIGAELVCAG
jgi:hypothetical protein